MRTTVEYLDAVKAKLCLPSDYAAAKALRVTRAAVSCYRLGVRSFDDATCMRVAEILEINPLEVIVSANFQRAKDEVERELWERGWEKFSANFQSLVSRADARQLSFWPV